MELLIVGLVIFFGVHLVPNIGNIRTRLLDRFGEKGYMPVYALLSLVGIVLISMGKSRAEFVSLWVPPVWGKSAALILMGVSIFLFVSIHYFIFFISYLHHTHGRSWFFIIVINLPTLQKLWF